eukprot:CAMPEP_0171709004 /NCGR_PEP_ID=MMETSP0991-20121206/15235_1 /TAXON_ID=483369 /ORGANISM="non described non described, Strain CCMP2098" /LENGTH=107 /DNA_ID=CAMNT_0012299059 /DNA_START=1 /DNA_END=320 /DNA_ORIENTATION=+
MVCAVQELARLEQRPSYDMHTDECHRSARTPEGKDCELDGDAGLVRAVRNCFECAGVRQHAHWRAKVASSTATTPGSRGVSTGRAQRGQRVSHHRHEGRDDRQLLGG